MKTNVFIVSEFEVIVIEGKSYFAIPINIYFKSSSNSENGICIIRAYAKSNPGQISVYQVRDFYFYLYTNNINKNVIEIEQTLELTNQTSNETKLSKMDSELQKNPPEDSDNNAIIIILISIAIAILIIIFRKLSERSESRTISLRHFAR